MQFPKGKAGPELNGPSIRYSPVRLLSQAGGNIRIIRTDLFPSETKALSCPHRNPDPPHSVITLTLSTNAALPIITSPAHNSAHLTICVLMSELLVQGGCSVFTQLLLGTFQRTKWQQTKQRPYGAQQGSYRNRDKCGPRSVFLAFLSYYLFSVTPGACKLFFGSTAILMTFTGARVPGQQKQQALGFCQDILT